MSAYPVKRPPLEPVKLAPMIDRPLISVIVPSFNQGRFIRETIDSILAQDYRPVQINVIDGASTDETVRILESYGDLPELDWVSEPDNGVVDAVNKGFALAKGDIIAIQSSDDRYKPGAFSIVVREFKSVGALALGMVYGDTVKIDGLGNEIQRNRLAPWSLKNLFLRQTWIPQPSCFFRRELLEACGGWDESIPYTPDTDLWIRMAFRTEVRKIDEYLAENRVHPEQRDTQSSRIFRDYRKMIEQSPDIAAAEPTLKRAARAGIHRIYGRYNPTGSHFRAIGHDLWASVLFPSTFCLSRLYSSVVIAARVKLQPIKKWMRTA